MDTLRINQATYVLKPSSVLRERAWQLYALKYRRIHFIDTTAETFYGNQQGGCLRHTPHRERKAYHLVLCFEDETRDFLLRKLRKGKVRDGEEAYALITQIKGRSPGRVKKVLLRAHGEFISWQNVLAATQAGFNFIIANKRGKPFFDPGSWYRTRRRSPIQHNSCVYQPVGW